jgi:exodeoxyribonuclease III
VRLVTWNCCRGDHRVKLGALARLSPDVAIVQECARPDGLREDGRRAWFGDNPKLGVAVIASNDFRVEALPSVGRASAYAARITGAVPFNVLAVWAQLTPTYARAVLDALEEHRSFLREGPSVVAGDFNTSSLLSKKVRGGGHADIVHALEQGLGLVSAYHHLFGEEHGLESRPTHYFQWNESKPFHIDYCFVPRAWSARIRGVTVGAYADWARESDHRPLVVDVAEDAAPCSRRP